MTCLGWSVEIHLLLQVNIACSASRLFYVEFRWGMILEILVLSNT